MKTALAPPHLLVACVLTLGALTACDSGPKTYDDCMLQASRTAQGDRQFRSMAEQCKEKFRDK